jgi:hypothetical protein
MYMKVLIEPPLHTIADYVTADYVTAAAVWHIISVCNKQDHWLRVETQGLGLGLGLGSG